MKSEKMKADRWERPAFLKQSAWESGRSLGCVGRGFNERLGNRCGLGIRRLHSIRDGLVAMQCRISILTAVANF
jgi:hypothetical protein